MPTLHLICGLPGAGKTTFARQLEMDHNALRLTPDEWHIPLFGMDISEPEHDARHDQVEVLMWHVAERALTLGVDVILDFGFWSQVEREDFRARAEQLGANSELHYLDVPEETLRARLAVRNTNLPAENFLVSPEQVSAWFTLLQAPAQTELMPRIGRQSGRYERDTSEHQANIH